MERLIIYLYLASLIFISIVLIRNYEPDASVAWIMALVFLPIVGALCTIHSAPGICTRIK